MAERPRTRQQRPGRNYKRESTSQGEQSGARRPDKEHTAPRTPAASAEELILSSDPLTDNHLYRCLLVPDFFKTKEEEKRFDHDQVEPANSSADAIHLAKEHDIPLQVVDNMSLQ